MLVQNNPTPWVVLALIVLVVCLAFGIVIGTDPFGPGQVVKAEQARTQLAVGISATEGALSAIQTPQAAFMKQTAVAAELTAIPMNQTATAIALVGEVKNSESTATQIALVAIERSQQLAYQATEASLDQQQTMNSLAYNATATAFVQEPIRNSTKNGVTLILIGISTLTTSVWILSRALIEVSRSHAKEKVAQAHFLLAEQRRLKAAQALLQPYLEKRAGKNISLPTQMLERGNGHGISHTE
jgi:hypothetical protein